MATLGASDIDWHAAVAKVVWVPAAHRNADVPASTALRMLRCTERSFAQLKELGLPSVDGPDGPLYDAFDLKNVGLYSGSDTTEIERSMRFLLDFMKADRRELTRPIRRSYRLRLVSSGADGDNSIRRVYRPTPEVFGGELHSWASSTAPQPQLDGACFTMRPGSEVSGSLTNCGTEQRIRSSTIREIATALLESGVRWHYLPMSLVERASESFDLRAASCAVLCRVLEERLVAAGFEATAYHGWINAATQIDHGWVEVVDEDGHTKCLDPSLALLAVDNGFGTRDFFDFVLGSFQNRVMPTRAPLNHPFVVDGTNGETVVLSTRPEER